MHEKFGNGVHFEDLQQSAKEESIHCHPSPLALACLFFISTLAQFVLLALGVLHPGSELLAAGQAPSQDKDLQSQCDWSLYSRGKS